MSVQELALRLPRTEKWRLAEALWADLRQDDAEINSPAWHEKALQETRLRVESGEEIAVDWDIAKQQLRTN
jgi:head-tail adaptor